MKIRNLSTTDDYRAAERFQRAVWHFPDRELIPLNELVVIQKHGGCVFGAFEMGKMAAFCFGMAAYRDGKAYHYSRMLGVLPEYRDRGLGYRMKLRQRELVLDQGLDLIRWTFDPLQSRNASLNITKLGCVVREYIENIYPDSDSQFNRGLATDRFVPEWRIRSRHVDGVLSGTAPEPDPSAYAPLLEVRWNRKGWVEPVRLGRIRERRVSVEIPADMTALKLADLPLAQRWRALTRRAFTGLFARGYVLHGFVSEVAEGRRRSRYLLEKGFKIA